jgi:subtilisin family serine protease
VAGIAAGANGPGGGTGVGQGASLMAMQVFTRFDDSTSCGSAPTPCARSYVSDQVLALNRVAALAGAGQQIAAANVSLGGGQFTSQATCDSSNTSNGRKAAIDNLRSLGVAVVAASGNNGFRTSTSAPACISSAVSIGSIDDNGAVSSFSNNAPFLTLYAPGGSIVSSVPGNAFESKQGTSMAAPHVAGAWAILRQAGRRPP